MATMYPNGNFHSEKEQLKAEIQELKLELQVLKIEMNKFKEFMNTKASFVDFKVFKFNEDQEKNKIREITSQLNLNLWSDDPDELPF